MKVEKCGEVPIILMGIDEQQKMRLFQKKQRGKEKSDNKHEWDNLT